MNLEAFRKAVKFDLTGLLFILTMGIALNPSVMGISLPQTVIVAITVFWLFIASLLAFGGHGPRVRGEGAGAFSCLARFFLVPKLLIWAYGIMLFVVGVGSREYFSTGYTQIASIVLPLCALYIFRRKTVDYIFWACVISFVPVVLLTCAEEGIGCLGAPFLSVIDSVVQNPFENHQFTFTAAFLLVYYLCLKDERGSRDILPIVGCSIMVFMGFKRILVLSIVAVVLLSIMCERITPQAKRKVCKAASICLFVGCWIWVWLIYSGTFFQLVDALGIQTMSRTYYYQIVVNNTAFSPLFPGMGLNAVSNMLTSTYSYLGVGGVHSDILKYYAEIGFLGFLAWTWFYLFSLPRMIERRFGDAAAYGFYLTNIFAFVIYFTDNIDIYFGSQLLYVAISFVYAMTRSDGFIDPRPRTARGHSVTKSITGSQHV